MINTAESKTERRRMLRDILADESKMERWRGIRWRRANERRAGVFKHEYGGRNQEIQMNGMVRKLKMTRA